MESIKRNFVQKLRYLILLSTTTSLSHLLQLTKSKMILLVIIVTVLITALPYVIAPPKEDDPCDTPGTGSAKYWFYVEDPSAYSFYDPEAGPNYVSIVADAWVTESVVHSINWESKAGTDVEFSFWMVVTNSESQNTKVVISINKAAYEGIVKIWINGEEATPWTTSSHSILSPHGVFNSAEFYGYYEYDVGYLAETTKGGIPTVNPVELSIKVEVDDDATNDIKIHLDAYGCEGSGPYSHDAIATYWPKIPLMVVNEALIGSISFIFAGVAAVLVMKRVSAHTI